MPSAGRMARPLVAALLLIRLLDESTGFLAPGHIEQFHRELHASYAALGFMLAMPYFGALSGNVFVARSDGTNRKAVAVGGAFVLAASMFVSAAAHGVVVLCVGAFAFGVGSTCLVEAGEIALAGASDESLERTLSRVNLFGTIGDIAGPLVIAATRVMGVEWRWLFIAAGVFVGLYAAFLAGQKFPPPIAAPRSSDTDLDQAAMVPILRHRAVWWIGVAAFVTSPLDEAFLGTVLAYAEERRSLSGATAMFLGAGFVAGGLIVYTVLVRHIEARDAPAMLTICGIAMAASSLAVLFVPGVVLVLIGLVHSASLNAQWLSLQAAALRVAPGREGRAGALIDLIDTASVGVPIAFGIVADRYGLSWSIACFAGLSLLLLLPASGLRAARRVPTIAREYARKP
jgi:MFS transporter, FSR family, fosmidomycin resistance protein